MSLGKVRAISLDHARRINILANWATFAFLGAIFFVGALLIGMF